MKAWRDLTLDERLTRHVQGEEALVWWLMLLTAAIVALAVKVLMFA